MKIQYLGHSACLVQTGDHALLIDPFLSGNGACPVKPGDIKCDFILLTHAHNDHFGDTIEIAKANDATVIAGYELACYCESKGLTVHPMGLGGKRAFPFGSVKLTLAHHSSSYTEEDGSVVAVGTPNGFLIEADGTTLYHAGDTALFLDMKMIGEMFAVDVALLPIGDNFTMGIEDATAALDLIRPRIVIPVHYNTFPPIEVDATLFKEAAETVGVQCALLAPGEELEA